MHWLVLGDNDEPQSQRLHQRKIVNHVNKIVMSRRTVTQTHDDRGPTMRIDVGRGVSEPVQGVSSSC